MKLMPLLNPVFSMLAVISFTGCAMFNKNVVTHTRTTTIGQELADLYNAKESGAVTEAEYNKLKSEILNDNAEEHDCECDD